MNASDPERARSRCESRTKRKALTRARRAASSPSRSIEAPAPRHTDTAVALCNTDAGLNARDAERFALRSWRHRGWNGDCLTRDMAKALGCKRWAIAEGYLPPDDESKARELVSHEAACILNASDEDAHVEVMIHFTDREPIGPYRVTVLARRTLHLRFNDLDTPEPIPRGTDYSSVIESDVPIVVQHTRLDSRVGLALLSTLAFAAS